MIGSLARVLGPQMLVTDTNYKCLECEVYGFGTACWLCGSAILLPNKWPALCSPGPGALTR